MRRLRKLTQVSRALTHATSLDQVLSLTVAEAVQLLGGSRAALLLYDQDGHLQVRATHAITAELVVRADEGPEATLERLLGVALGEAFEENAVAVPLIVSGKVTGALAVIRGAGLIPEEEEEWLLSALADQTMVALEKERLDVIQGRAQQQALVARVGHRLLAHHDVQSLFDEMLAAVCETLDVDLAGFFARKSDESFELLGGKGWPTSSASAPREQDLSSVEERAFSCKIPISFGATRDDEGAASEAFRYEPRVTSGLVVAVEPPDRYGVLGIYTRAPRIFTQEESDMLSSLGALLSSALEREAVEAQLRTAAEMRDDLLAIVSHDLRNPLFAIISAADLLSEGGVLEDRTAALRWVEVIGRNGRRMAGMIRDLLDFESLRGRGLSMALAEHGIAQLLGETVEMMQAQAAEKSLQLTAAAPASVTAWCDRERTLQVLSNLLGNAVKFTPEGGTITLGAEVLPDGVRIFVRDTGPGIPQEDLLHVFDRYWQAKRSDRRGIGLGLPISKGIVEGQGGKLWVESELGRGTTFFFTLPGRDPRSDAP